MCDATAHGHLSGVGTGSELTFTGFTDRYVVPGESKRSRQNNQKVCAVTKIYMNQLAVCPTRHWADHGSEPVIAPEGARSRRRGSSEIGPKIGPAWRAVVGMQQHVEKVVRSGFFEKTRRSLGLARSRRPFGAATCMPPETSTRKSNERPATNRLDHERACFTSTHVPSTRTRRNGPHILIFGTVDIFFRPARALTGRR